MVASANMTQLNMIGVMNLHPASAVLATEVIPIEVQIAMEAISFSPGAGCLFRCPVIYEIYKIVGE